MSHKASLACAGARAFDSVRGQKLKRRRLLLTSFGLVAFAGPAFAADLAPPPLAPPVAPPFTWTGVYLGGQIGYAWGADNIYYNAYDPLSGVLYTPSVSASPSGVIGGAHVGVNYQIDKPGGGFVLGLEGSVDGLGSRNTVSAGFGAFGGGSASASTTADIQGSVRGRFGIAWDRLMAYATGGVAFGGFKTNYAVAANASGSAAINGGAPFYGSNGFSSTRVGWTAGGGIDYAITNNWSVFAEYRYTSFGTTGNVGLPTPAFAAASGLVAGPLSSTRTLNQSQVQAGFSYKFDINAPNPGFFSIF
jgi:outer membrane immunogenic protein